MEMFFSKCCFQMHKQPRLMACVQLVINHSQSRTGEEQLLSVPHKKLMGWDVGQQRGTADEFNRGICISCKIWVVYGKGAAMLRACHEMHFPHGV